MAEGNKNIKLSNITQLLLGVLIIVLVNIIASYVFTRFDLTSEKRYTLSETTRDMLREIDDVVYFRVYLEGEFPAGFKRLRNATKEMLDEFRAYNKNIHYEFINPSGSEDAEERNSTYQLLVEKGLQPTDLQMNTKDGREQQIIFPGAIAAYKSREIADELLKSQLGVPPEEVLNNSIQNLEYNLASVIRSLIISKKPEIAVIDGHGELDNRELYDIAISLQENYSVERITIDGQLNSLTRRDSIGSGETAIVNKFNAIIIAKPESEFSEKDKFIIDQYIMRGGNVLWLIDPVHASMDSLAGQESTMGLTRDLNLDDMLFKYGVKLNGNLVMDISALPIPLKTGQIGNQPQIDFFPWYFFPVITPLEQHPIVSNLNAIKTEFVSSIDTVAVGNVDKTILLKTSPYSRIVNSPVMISLGILEQEADERMYTAPPQIIAVLLEGEFESNFENRIPPEIRDNREIGFVSSGEAAKMIIVSDGDIIRNQFHYKDGYPLPLGYDQYTGESFGNKDFILNAVNYLTDNTGLVEIRSRELKLRLLDMTRVNNNKLFWQVFNTLSPVILIIIFGLIMTWMRRRKYSRRG